MGLRKAHADCRLPHACRTSTPRSSQCPGSSNHQRWQQQLRAPNMQSGACLGFLWIVMQQPVRVHLHDQLGAALLHAAALLLQHGLQRNGCVPHRPAAWSPGRRAEKGCCLCMVCTHGQLSSGMCMQASRLFAAAAGLLQADLLRLCQAFRKGARPPT